MKVLKNKNSIISKKISEAVVNADAIATSLTKRLQVAKALQAANGFVYDMVFSGSKAIQVGGASVDVQSQYIDENNNYFYFYTIPTVYTSSVENYTYTAEEFKATVMNYFNGIMPDKTVTIDLISFIDRIKDDNTVLSYLAGKNVIMDASKVLEAVPEFKGFTFSSLDNLYVILGLFMLASSSYEAQSIARLDIDPYTGETSYQFSYNWQAKPNPSFANLLTQMISNVLLAYDTKRIKLIVKGEEDTKEYTLFDLVYNLPVGVLRGTNVSSMNKSFYEVITEAIGVNKAGVENFLKVVRSQSFLNDLYNLLRTKPSMKGFKTAVYYRLGEIYESFGENLGIFTLPYLRKVLKETKEIKEKADVIYKDSFLSNFLFSIDCSQGNLVLNFYYYYYNIGQGSEVHATSELMNLRKKLQERGVLANYKITLDKDQDISIFNDEDVKKFIDELNRLLLTLVYNENVFTAFMDAADIPSNYRSAFRNAFIRKLQMTKDFAFVPVEQQKEMLSKVYYLQVGEDLERIYEEKLYPKNNLSFMLETNYSAETGEGAMEGTHCIVASIYDTVTVGEPYYMPDTIEEGRKNLLEKVKHFSPVATNETEWKAISTLLVARTISGDTQLDYVVVNQPNCYAKFYSHKAIALNYLKQLIHTTDTPAAILLEILHNLSSLFVTPDYFGVFAIITNDTGLAENQVFVNVLLMNIGIVSETVFQIKPPSNAYIIEPTGQFKTWRLDTSIAKDPNKSYNILRA